MFQMCMSLCFFLIFYLFSFLQPRFCPGGLGNINRDCVSSCYLHEMCHVHVLPRGSRSFYLHKVVQLVSILEEENERLESQVSTLHVIRENEDFLERSHEKLKARMKR